MPFAEKSGNWPYQVHDMNGGKGSFTVCRWPKVCRFTRPVHALILYCGISARAEIPCSRESRQFFACAIALLPALTPAQEPVFPSTSPPATGRSALPADGPSDAALLKALRKGGYVIYFRHASTDFSRDDSRSRADDDCENQRPLTDTGREDARQIGAAMRELEIPVGKVLASPRCRAMETAMLAFGRAETSAAVRGGPGRDSGRRAYLAEGEAAVVRPPGKDFEIVARVRHDAWGVLQGKH